MMELHHCAKSVVTVVTTRVREATVYTNTHPISMDQRPKHDVFEGSRSFGSQIAYRGHLVSDIRIRVERLETKLA